MISIIIPTYNEEGQIGKTLHHLFSCPDMERVTEIIVADGGSVDNTRHEAAVAGAQVITSHRKGRAMQMNYGAAEATGSVLYFLHADSLPPADFIGRILRSIEKGNNSGCFRLRFDCGHWLLRTVAWFTRFNSGLIRFGDQSLFIKKDLFHRIGGFDETYQVMEDHEIIRRIKRVGKFGVIPSYITTSARKFIENGPYRLMGIFFYIYILYYIGVSQPVLLNQYRKRITNGKL